MSGVRTSSTLASFQTWRGNTVDYQNKYSSASWTDIENPNASRFVSLGLLPGNDPTQTLAQAATGAYDSHYLAAADSLVAAGYPDAYVRLGWEFNLNSSAWSANPGGARNAGVDNTANFRAAMQHAITAMRSVPGAQFRFVFSPSNGTTASAPDPALAYPGDGYIDAVMPDQYDKWYNHPGASLADRWNQLLTGGGRGITFWYDFAKGHGKSFGFAEWGLWDTASTTGGVSQGGGGDDPGYIDKVADFLATARSEGVDTMEAYFNASATDADHLIFPVTSSQFPNGSAEYLARFGG